MAYIQVELMAIEHAEFAAQSLGCKRVEVLGGLVELWQFSWKRCEDIHQTSVLQAWFAFEPSKTLSVLEAFGFAEDLKNGTFRVRGAERYLRIREQRAAAGKKGGLKRAEKAAQKLQNELEASAKQVPSKCLAIASNDENAPKTEPKNEAEIKQVLSKSLASAKQVLSKSLEGAKQVSGNTEHRTQNTEHRDKNIVANATSEETKKPKKTKKTVDPEYSERRKSLLTALEASYEQKRGSKYLHQGAKDEDALKRLIGRYDDKLILERWALGLTLTKWPGVSTIAQLGSRFNELGQQQPVNQQLTTPKPKPKSTAEMLEESVKNAPTFKPLKERNPELWAKNEKWKAHQQEMERQREEKLREYEKLQLEKLREPEKEKLKNADLEWETSLAQGEK